MYTVSDDPFRVSLLLLKLSIGGYPVIRGVTALFMGRR